MKILIVCARPLDYESNIGLTLCSVLEQFGPKSVSQVFQQVGTPSRDVFGDAYQLPIEAVPGWRLATRLAGPQGQRVVQNGPVSSVPPGDSKLQTNLRSALRAHADLIPYSWPKSLGEWLKRVQPSVIVSPLETIRQMRLCLAIATQTGARIAPHIADDWISTAYTHSRFHALPRQVLLSTFRRILRRARCCMTGSVGMAEEYRDRFGVRCIPVLQGVHVPTLSVPASDERRPLKLVYAGRLGDGRWAQICKLSRLMRGSGVPWMLNVYAPMDDCRAYGEALREAGVQSLDSVPSGAVPAILAEADVLLHVESFDPRIRKFTRLSFSTKLSQYLAAGKPTLLWTPSDIHMTQYFSGNALGLVETEESGAVLIGHLRALEDIKLRTQLGAGARDWAMGHHAKAIMSSRFLEAVGLNSN